MLADEFAAAHLGDERKKEAKRLCSFPHMLGDAIKSRIGMGTAAEALCKLIAVSF